jgi:transaldolase
LKRKKIKTNMTCLITPNQVLLAVLAGATYVSIFFNRVRDAGLDAFKTVLDSKRIIADCGSSAELIVGSIRKPEDVYEIATASPHIITIPYKILVQMPFHQKTEDTIKEFDQAWQEFKKCEVQKR